MDGDGREIFFDRVTLSLAETAGLLGVSRRHLERLVAANLRAYPTSARHTTMAAAKWTRAR
jgi:hypothetical protein